MLLLLQMSETVEARGIPHARCGSLWSETLMTRSDSSAYPVIARSLKESALSDDQYIEALGQFYHMVG